MPVTRGVRVNVSFESPVMDLPPVSDADILDITCGMLTAKLHRERFICPGINRECIEYDGKFVTPKTFYVLADKGSLKDWKNAIRINGKKIRRYIDSGQLDFYNHQELCTGRCKSRMGQRTSMLLHDHINPSQMFRSKPDSSNGTNGNQNSSNESYMQMTDSFGEPKDIKPSVDQLNHMMMLNLQPEQNGNQTEMPTSSQNQPIQLHPVQVVPIGQNTENEDDDDTMFWRAIVQLGLIDEFFREIKSKLDSLKVSMIKQFVPIDDAKKASLIVNELGMKSKLDMRLYAHKYEFDRQRDKLEKEMEQLKKKVSEYEQKKEVLKRKSDCYDQLMTKKSKNGDSSDLQTYTIETQAGRAMLLVNGDQMSELRSQTPSPFQALSQDSTLSPSPIVSQDSTVTSAESSEEASVESSQSSGSGARTKK